MKEKEKYKDCTYNAMLHVKIQKLNIYSMVLHMIKRII